MSPPFSVPFGTYLALLYYFFQAIHTVFAWDTIDSPLSDLHMISLITHQVFSLVRDWSEPVTLLNMPQLKLINIRSDIPCACCKKYLKDNKHNSFHLARKYARIFFLGYYLLLKAHMLPTSYALEKLFVSPNR